MVLNNGNEEFELKYTIGAFTRLKKELKCENLRKTLLLSTVKQDYEPFTQALKVFSNGKIPKSEDAYPVIDRYVCEHNTTYYDMFMEFAEELDAAGFFNSRMSREELNQLATSPELELSMDDMMMDALKSLKGEALNRLIKEMIDAPSSDMKTGASTSQTSAQPLMGTA